MIAAPAESDPSGLAPFWREVWTGADATSRNWLLYSGVTIAPWSGIHDTGWRLRFAAGYGQYRTDGTARHLVAAGAGGGTVDVAYRSRGQIAYGDVLVGYLWRLGALTAKAFVGASIIDHRTLVAEQSATVLGPNGIPFGLEVALEGGEVGLKTALELWLNLGSNAWSSLDLNWTSAHETYSARLRAAWRAWPTVSLGVEGILNGNGQQTLGRFASDLELGQLERRAGLFLRYEWFGGEVSLAGGLSVSPGDSARPYATLNWITQF